MRHAHRYQVPCSRAPKPSSAAHAHAGAAANKKNRIMIIGIVHSDDIGSYDDYRKEKARHIVHRMFSTSTGSAG
jgi:hypothetical protein